MWDVIDFVYLTDSKVRLFRYYPETYVIERKYVTIKESDFQKKVLQYGWTVALNRISGKVWYVSPDTREEAKKVYDRFRKAAEKAGFKYLPDDPKSIDDWLGKEE